MEQQRLFDFVETQVAQQPAGVMLASKINGAWQTISCKEVMNRARDLASGLLSLGIANEELHTGKAGEDSDRISRTGRSG